MVLTLLLTCLLMIFGLVDLNADTPEWLNLWLLRPFVALGGPG